MYFSLYILCKYYLMRQSMLLLCFVFGHNTYVHLNSYFVAIWTMQLL